jgi:hypothetical protein
MLSIEFNGKVVKQQLHASGKSYFEPATQWDLKDSQE